MTLITSGRATGRRCLICGSPDGGCGGAHASNEPTPVDVPTEGARPMAPDCIAERIINGQRATVLANSAVAEREGWPIVSAIGGGPFHKKRPKPEAPAPVEPESVEPEPDGGEDEDQLEDRRAELEALTKADLYDLASNPEREITGRSTMSKAELIEALLEASP